MKNTYIRRESVGEKVYLTREAKKREMCEGESLFDEGRVEGGMCGGKS